MKGPPESLRQADLPGDFAQIIILKVISCCHLNYQSLFDWAYLDLIFDGHCFFVCKSTSCNLFGYLPGSAIRPHPATVALLPRYVFLSPAGKQTGLIILLNFTEVARDRMAISSPKNMILPNIMYMFGQNLYCFAAWFWVPSFM